VNEHPTPAELEGFVWNRVSAERAREIIAHLMGGCSPCYQQVKPHLQALFGVAEPPPRAPLSPLEDAEYDAAIDRAFSSVLRTLREARRREALTLLADGGLESLPEFPEHLQGMPLFEALLERSWSFRHESPARMVRFAEWARTLAETFEPAALGAAAVADLQCRAWIELGNAYRVADDLAAADRALGRSLELFDRGTRDELLAARLFDVQASLLGDSRRFDLAETALDMVFAIHLRRGDRHLAGRALVSKAMYAGYQGESEEAIRLMEQGLDLIDAERDPRLLSAGLHNLARLLLDTGRAREARIVLWKAKTRGLDAGGRVNELKARWLEAQVNTVLNELGRAELALTEVRRGFEEEGLVYKAALAGLELGTIHLRQGRPDLAVPAVLEAADVFMALGISREAGASVLLLRKAFEREMVDAALLDYVIGLLRKTEDAPRETFGVPGRE
jgi:tetratricopeptide (TPR) repeat protein